MEYSYAGIITSIINIVLFLIVVFAVYKALSGAKNLLNKIKEMDRKLDMILERMKSQDGKL